MASGRIRKSLAKNPEEALRLFSERALWSDLNLAESEFVLEEALKCYGSVQDGDLIAELFAFYRRYMGLADVARRQALLTRLVEFVSDGRQNRAMALLCFIASDTDGQIISGAALDLAMVLPADKDPLAGPKLVAMHSCGGLRELTGSKPSDDEGHAAAGLLLLGDLRLLPILKDIWGRLSTDARNNMIKRRGNLAYKATIEFLLQRLEEDKDEVHFGELGAFLHDLAGISASATQGLVLDARRNFGLPKGREPMELLSRQTVEEVYEEIAPRLRRLIARESSPKVLPSVLERWAESAGVDLDETEPQEEADESEDDEPEIGDEEEGDLTISEERAAEFAKVIATQLPQDGSGSPVRMWFNLYHEHSKVTSERLHKELAAGEVFPLLLTGLFNPLSPTITLYVVRHAPFEEWSLWCYTLNPFSCSSKWVADLDNEKIQLAYGALDVDESQRRGTLVFNARDAASGAVVLRSLVNDVLGRSQLQPQFTLCHFTVALPENEAFDMVGVLLAAGKNSSEDVANLRDPAKRDDPWARLDPVAALRLSRGDVPKGKPVGLADKYEFAMRVLSPEQRKIELDAILLAWDGALAMAKSAPVALARESLVRLLLNLTPDMPGLLQMSEQEGRTSSTRAASSDSGASAKREKNAPGYKPKTRALNSPLPGLKYGDEPKFTGLTSFIYNFGIYEIWFSLGLLIYALTMSDWLLAVCLLVFGILSAAKAGSMALAVTAARWWGVVLYVSMGSFVFYRLNNFSTYNGMSDSSTLLHQGILWWVAIMALLHILCFDFAKQVGAAKKS